MHQFQKLPQQPLSLKLLPLRVPKPTMVPIDRAQQIEGELGHRLRRDQITQRGQFEELWGKRRKPGAGSFDAEDLRLLAVKSDNTAYLKSLIAEVGWVDSQRFGSTAADAAFLLAQHSQDLPLMLAALPEIKEEVDAGRLEGETYALLYDRIQLLLGKPQRYGTRMGQDVAGKPVVLLTEEPDKVDTRRRDLGMTPLSQYVGVFGAVEVRFSSACSPSKDSR
ncbi:MAG TPA: DUF6624 domain-containing protein [Thermoanaerobaculia bacterium]|nr:DUF6624 domain-containing protein [Thermoanaerobaculia bacterium]